MGHRQGGVEPELACGERRCRVPRCRVWNGNWLRDSSGPSEAKLLDRGDCCRKCSCSGNGCRISLHCRTEIGGRPSENQGLCSLQQFGGLAIRRIVRCEGWV